MNDTPDKPTSEGHRPTAATVPDAAGQQAEQQREAQPALVGVPRMPSPRVTVALTATMLVIGASVGAAIGPSPSSSLAGTAELPLLLRTLSALEAGRQTSATAPAQRKAAPRPASAATSSPARTSAAPTQVFSAPSSSTPTETKPSLSSPTTGAKGTHAKALPPTTSVWLIELSGQGFAQVKAQPTAAPYLTGQAIPAGRLLSGWSTLDASAIAGEAGLLAGEPPQTLDTIVQPPCPEGAGGASCAPATPGALTAADEFAKQVIPTITATAAYRTHGLIVVTFSTVAAATATGLPARATSATLSSRPPAGVLLISPFASPGAHPSTSFNPATPRKSLEGLLHQ